MKIKNDIKLARTKKNLSQKQLAQLLKVDVSVIESWESGERVPNLEERKFLSDILDIPYRRSPKIKNLVIVAVILSIQVIAFLLLNREEKSWTYVSDELKVNYHFTNDEEAIELKSVAYRIDEDVVEFKIDADVDDFMMITCFNRDVEYVRRSYYDKPEVIRVEVKHEDILKMDKLGISILIYSDKGEGKYGNTADLFIYFDELLPRIHEEMKQE